MNVVLLCGSPRAKKSNSAYLLEQLSDRMGGSLRVETRQAAATASGVNERTAELVAASDALVVALPLYADAIPSALYEVLGQIRARAFGNRIDADGVPDREQRILRSATERAGHRDAVELV